MIGFLAGNSGVVAMSCGIKRVIGAKGLMQYSTAANRMLWKPTAVTSEKKIAPFMKTRPTGLQKEKLKRRGKEAEFTMDDIIPKFECLLMESGKKARAESVLNKTRAMIKVKELGKPGMPLSSKDYIIEALENAKPVVLLTPKRIGSSVYQIPTNIKEKRAYGVAMKTIIEAARKRKNNGKRMHERLFTEIVDAYNKKGTAIQKKIDTHKMAEANRTYAHYLFR
eukprot:Nk52_evm117s226 gene=Nk52_evmTU117s226